MASELPERRPEEALLLHLDVDGVLADGGGDVRDVDTAGRVQDLHWNVTLARV